MKLTPLAKAFIVAVVAFVIGFATWHYQGDAIKRWVGGEKAEGGDSKGDFDRLKGGPGDPSRNAGSTGVSSVSLGTGKLSRPLVVGINTWAGHSPGIVFNSGMEPNAASNYKKKYGMDVKFVLLEDPSSKLAAFRSGQVDIMWNTVDNWAREASILAEQNQNAKSIIMQDWSRGGDGIASLASIKSVEDLKGHKIACTQFTPSHFLLLYLLAQSGFRLKTGRRRRTSFSRPTHQRPPPLSKPNGDAAVTWEPDLSGAVTARRRSTRAGFHQAG
jgi:ABC-type nitrate/sulfonate/bicarbonate transport system substrate-binding protein